MDDEMLTYEQAARLLNLKIGTLYALVAQNRVPHLRLGRRLIRFSRNELIAWLRRHAVGPAPQAASGAPRETKQ
jgi:excisionase family DNA binding protein